MQQPKSQQEPPPEASSHPQEEQEEAVVEYVDPSELAEPYRSFLRSQAEISLRTYRRLTLCFAIFVCLLLSVVIAVSVVLASRPRQCEDFSNVEKSLISQKIHPGYQPNTWAATVAAPGGGVSSPPPRLAHCDASVAERYVFIFGGTYGSAPLNIPYVAYADLWMYDQQTKLWTNVTSSMVGDLPPARLHCSLNSMDDDTLLLFGGFNVFQNLPNHTGLQDFYHFRISTSTWTRLDVKISGVGPTRRGAHGAEWLNGALYIFGGFPVIGPTGHIKELWVFTWATQSWANMSMPPMSPPGLIGFSMIATNASAIFFTGGGCSVTVEPTGQYRPNWYYYPSSNSWLLLNPVNAPPARRASDATASVGGILYQFGGIWLNGTSSFTIYKDLEAFDTSSLLWMPMYPNYNRGPMPPPTFGHSATRAGRWVVLFGGRINSPAQPGSSQTWEYTAITPNA